jgi:predicted nucleic acid-binding protein
VKRKVVLDSFALLAYLENERGAEKVKRHLAAKDAEILINDINLGEVYYIIARERSIEDADHFMEVVFPSLPVARVENGLQEVIDAARIKAEHALSYADCFAVATARTHGALLVTGDPEFKKVQGLIELDFI